MGCIVLVRCTPKRLQHASAHWKEQPVQALLGKLVWKVDPCLRASSRPTIWVVKPRRPAGESKWNYVTSGPHLFPSQVRDQMRPWIQNRWSSSKQACETLGLGEVGGCHHWYSLPRSITTNLAFGLAFLVLCSRRSTFLHFSLHNSIFALVSCYLPPLHVGPCSNLISHRWRFLSPPSARPPPFLCHPTTLTVGAINCSTHSQPTTKLVSQYHLDSRRYQATSSTTLASKRIAAAPAARPLSQHGNRTTRERAQAAGRS